MTLLIPPPGVGRRKANVSMPRAFDHKSHESLTGWAVGIAVPLLAAAGLMFHAAPARATPTTYVIDPRQTITFSGPITEALAGSVTFNPLSPTSYIVTMSNYALPVFSTSETFQGSVTPVNQTNARLATTTTFTSMPPLIPSLFRIQTSAFIVTGPTTAILQGLQISVYENGMGSEEIYSGTNGLVTLTAQSTPEPSGLLVLGSALGIVLFGTRAGRRFRQSSRMAY